MMACSLFPLELREEDEPEPKDARPLGEHWPDEQQEEPDELPSISHRRREAAR